MKKAAICIATYRRHQGLQRLLSALACQTTPQGWTIEVRVVCNDAKQHFPSFCNMVDQFYPGAIVRTESRRNIAHARNAAIAVGRADAYLFIDDDEVPSAGWLRALLIRLQQDDADAVFGPVIGRPHAGAPNWLVRAGVFDKPGPNHDGKLHWTQTRTSSTAVRGNWIGPGFLTQGHWFDPSFGTSGGSDVAFFKHIAERGARFVHERKAFVYEDIEPERCSSRAVLQRRYRAGVVLGRMERSRTQLRRALTCAKRVVAGTLKAVAGVVIFPFKGPGLVFAGICKAAVGIGAYRGYNTRYTVTRYEERPQQNHSVSTPRTNTQQTQAAGGLACASLC